MADIPRHCFSADHLPADIGARLLAMRVAARWSQATLARRSGVARETIIRIEKGHRAPRADTVLHLLSVLLAERDDIELQNIVPDWPEAGARQIIGHGPRSRERRRQLGLTAAMLAEAAGVSEATLSRFERSAGPTPSLLKIEITGLGDHMPRLSSEALARGLQFRSLAEHEAFCDAEDWQSWPACKWPKMPLEGN